MKGRSFKFDATHAFLLLGLIFLSSLLYLFLSQRGRSSRIEYFSEPQYRVEYYYMQGCPFCVKFDPIWSKVIPQFEGKVDFQKLEISKNMDRASKFNINSAPTVIVIQKSKDAQVASLLSEERSEQGFADFVKKYVA